MKKISNNNLSIVLDKTTGTISNSRLLSRFYTSADGQTFQVVFFVEFVAGKLQARVVSVTPILDRRADSDCKEIKCLSASSSGILQNLDIHSGQIVQLSPYLSLLFLTSQPTRAPSSR